MDAQLRNTNNEESWPIPMQRVAVAIHHSVVHEEIFPYSEMIYFHLSCEQLPTYRITLIL